MEAEERIRKLVLLGDNRQKQGLLGKARESYVQALELAREAGTDGSVGALIELRLADLDSHSTA